MTVVRCPRHAIQFQGYGCAEYVRRVMELEGVARGAICWEASCEQTERLNVYEPPVGQPQLGDDRQSKKRENAEG